MDESMDHSRTPEPASLEEAVDQSLLAATKLRMGSDQLADATQGVTAETFGHAGIAQQVQELFGQFSAVMNSKADELDRASLAALEEQRRRSTGNGDD